MTDFWDLISANSEQCILYSFSLYTSLLTSFLFLSLCVYHLFGITDSYQSTLRNNPEEQIHKLRSGGSLDITRYPVPSKNHRNTCCKGYRVPAP